MFGALGDNFGRKRLMLIGWRSSVVIDRVRDLGQPERARDRTNHHGIGAAASEPATLSMIRHIYPDHKARARALGGGPRCRDSRSPWDRSLAASSSASVVARGLLVQPRLRRVGVHRRGDCVARKRELDPPESRLRGLLLRGGHSRHRDVRVYPGRVDRLRERRVITLFIVSFLTIPVSTSPRRVRSPMLELGFFRRKSFTGAAFIAFASTSRSSPSSSSSRCIWKSSRPSVPTDCARLSTLARRIVVASLSRDAGSDELVRGFHDAGLPSRRSGVLLTYAAIGPNVGVSTLGWTMGLAGIGFGIVIVPVNATALSSLPPRTRAWPLRRSTPVENSAPWRASRSSDQS